MQFLDNRVKFLIQRNFPIYTGETVPHSYVFLANYFSFLHSYCYISTEVNGGISEPAGTFR